MQHDADEFLTKSLVSHFKGIKKWHFYSVDHSNRPLVSFTSKVIDRLGNMVSNLSFMKTTKEKKDVLF